MRFPDTLGERGAMVRDRLYICTECAEEFVVSHFLYARVEWILLCPCCGNVHVHGSGDVVPAAEAGQMVTA
jgi:hypothetical protein